jgi:hypothetical protein
MEVLGHYLAIFKASGSRRAVAKKKVRGWKIHAVSPTKPYTSVTTQPGVCISCGALITCNALALQQGNC